MSQSDAFFHMSNTKTTRDVYKAHPLDRESKCIRVLDIKPLCSETGDIPIETSMCVVDLEEQTAFTALSYVWGSYAVQRHTIMCDNVPFEVTSNCYSALWHLRQNHGSIRIWLDAICINQEDETEKSQQIPFMGDIYSKATTTYIWLGEGSNSSEKTMAYLAMMGMQRYKEGVIKHRVLAAWSFFCMWVNPWSQCYPFISSRRSWLRPDRHITIEDLRSLLDREWLHRVWTYQEILLASNPVLICGSRLLDWATFEWSILFLCYMHYDLLKDIIIPWESIILGKENLGTSTTNNPKPLKLKYENFISRVVEYLALMRTVAVGLLLFFGFAFVVEITEGVVEVLIIYPFLFIAAIYLQVYYFKFRAYNRNDRGQVSADEDLLEGLYIRKATNPKDMAYGMWSVLRILGVTDLQEPSYIMDIEQIYHIFTVHLIKITRSLDFLPMAAAQGLPGTPSWVPDWSAVDRHKWTSYGGHPGVNYIGWSFNTLKDMAGHRLLERQYQIQSVDEDEAVLTVAAACLGRIQDYAVFHRSSDLILSSEKDLHTENLRNMILCAEWTIDQGYPMAKTILTYSAAANAEWPTKFKKWEKRFRRSQRANLQETLDRWINNIKVPAWFNAFMRIQVLMCNLLAQQDRKICQAVINNEPYLTACSHNAQIDDHIIRIIGLPRLLVVRHLTDDHMQRAVKIISPMVLSAHAKWSEKRRNWTLIMRDVFTGRFLFIWPDMHPNQRRGELWTIH